MPKYLWKGKRLIHSGLVSITFRQLSPENVIKLASEVQLRGIEWGGDIHVPHGDLDTARCVGRMTRDAGLEVAAYGSYYFVGDSEPEGLEFKRVLESAQALEAPTIRVWAGRQGTDDADDASWSRVVGDAQRIAELAEKAGIRVCIEYHGKTLTDHHQAAIILHQRIGSENVGLLWQPLHNHSYEDQMTAVETMLPLVSNIHVYWWSPANRPAGYDRLPLVDGVDQWCSFFDILRRSGRERYAMLEFVKNDDLNQFRADAVVLNRLLSN